MRKWGVAYLVITEEDEEQSGVWQRVIYAQWRSGFFAGAVSVEISTLLSSRQCERERWHCCGTNRRIHSAEMSERYLQEKSACGSFKQRSARISV